MAAKTYIIAEKKEKKEIVGITARTIANYEKASVSTPYFDKILLLSEALEVDICDLCPSFGVLDPFEIVDKRNELEVEAIKEFLENKTKKDENVLGFLIEGFKESNNLNQRLHIDMVIHRSIVSYSNNLLARKFNGLLTEFCEVVEGFTDDTRVFSSQYIDEMNRSNEKLFQSILDRNLDTILTEYDEHRRLQAEAINSILSLNLS